MTGSRAVALFCLIALILLAIWRVFKRGANYRSVWSTGILMVLLAFATDVDSGLGAAVGVAILVFLLAKAVGGGVIQNTINPPKPTGGSQVISPSGAGTPFIA